MARPVVFRRGVGRDLATVYRWYEEQRPGLGEEFVAAVDAAFDAIEQFPEMFAAVHGDVFVAPWSLGSPTVSSIESRLAES